MQKGCPTSQLLRDLSRPPRKVARQRGLPVPVRCALFLLLPHVWLGVALLWAFINICGLALFSQERQAVVTSRNVQAVKSEGCEIRYMYSDRGGRHTDNGSLAADAYRLYPPGSTIQIRSVRIFGHSTSKLASDKSGVLSMMAVAIFVTIWDGLLLLHFCSLCLSPLIERRLLREGEAVMGRITDKTIPKKKSPVYGLAYVFTDMAGKARNDTMLVRRDGHELAQINDEVLAFYDPRKPKRSVLYAYSQYALREWCDAG